MRAPVPQDRSWRAPAGTDAPMPPEDGSPRLRCHAEEAVGTPFLIRSTQGGAHGRPRLPARGPRGHLLDTAILPSRL